jgi:hypothetical protein
MAYGTFRARINVGEKRAEIEQLEREQSAQHSPDRAIQIKLCVAQLAVLERVLLELESGEAGAREAGWH